MREKDELHIPGAATLKTWLINTASAPIRSTANTEILESLIRQCYTEIRSYRLAGHGWSKLAIKIRKECKVPCSDDAVKRIFSYIDREWAKKTGEPALPEVKVRSTLAKKRKAAAA